MSRALHAEILKDLSARKEWEDKQAIYYELRHEGLRRKNPPFSGAADLHYPLVDTLIDKFKPFYFAQIFGNENIARFVGLSPQSTNYTGLVAQWFDYQLTQESNLFEESLSTIDNMLMSGAAPVKVWWDTARARLRFDAIDPLFLIYPAGTVELDEADRITHVMQFSVSAYQRAGIFAADDATIARIKGKGSTEHDGGGKGDEKARREGITHGATDDQIVVWEVYQQQQDRTWAVSTFAPTDPDTPLREPFVLGPEYDGSPFVLFPAEIKDKGAYASRGIAERGGPAEAYLCKCWNEKADSMTFLNRPIFTRDIADSNLANVRLQPGTIVPGNLKRVEMGSVPFDFDQEMLATRMMAEQMFAVPDFGLGQQINTKERKTATEVGHMASLMAMSTDLRSWIFRRSLTKLLRKSWSLLKTYGSDRLRFFAGTQAQQLPPDALQGEYAIQPDGTPDGWNKERRFAKAQARYQQYFGKPFINQGELAKHSLEEDDPRLAKRLWQDPGEAAADQQEDQARECLILEEGWPARVQMADDDNAHLQVIHGRLQMHAAVNTPLSAGAARCYLQHIQAHLQKLAGTNKAQAAQWGQALAPFQPALQQLAAAQPMAAPAQEVMA